MFARLATLLPIAVLAAVATAAPNALEARDGSSCSTGVTYCCNNKIAKGTGLNGILGGLITLVAGANVDASLTCDPISIIGTGGNSCNSQVACCSNVKATGLINIVCDPIIINL